MEQVLRYSVLLEDKAINFLMRVIGVLAFITLVASIYNARINFYLWYYWHGHSVVDALKTIIIPDLPFSFFWLLLAGFGLFKSKKILLAVPLVSYFILTDYLYYIINYHTNLGSLYYSSQALALFGSITLILGNLALLLCFLKIYGSRIKDVCLKAKKRIY